MIAWWWSRWRDRRRRHARGFIVEDRYRRIHFIPFEITDRGDR